MKRILFIGLVLMLFLAGCGQNTPETTRDTADAATQARAQGLYVPGSALEQQSNGALRLYSLGGDDYHWISAIGDKLLLASGTDNTQITVLSGTECVPTATMVFASDLMQGSYQVTYNGFAYYDENQNQAVFLDPQLQENKRIQLPEDIQGKPAFSPDGGEIFYCVGQEIRSLDVERGLTRLVKSHACTSQTLLGSYFEGKMLACSVENEAGMWSTVYLSAQTGQTLSSDAHLLQLSTYENNYFAIRMDGIVKQCIFGTMDGAAQQINAPDGSVAAALELGGAVGCSIDEYNCLRLSFYDLASGKKTAAIDLPGVGEPIAFLADRWTGCLWILTTDLDSGSQILLRWDLKASSVQEESVYTGPAYTAQAPDEAELKDCQDRVDALNKQHGTTIRIWENAVRNPGSYSLEAEYQTPAISQCLDELEQVLNQFPQNFLYKSVSSRIRICIVRSVDARVAAVRYWYDGDAFIVLSVGVNVEAEFIKAVGYVVDSHVLGNSALLDTWESLNPEGFVYGGAQQSPQYLEGETRAFADSASMQSVTDDRAGIFRYAMQEGNAELFQSETMQKKLLLLCRAIRDAWRWEQKTETYPWEQYLTQPIAYVKN